MQIRSIFRDLRIGTFMNYWRAYLPRFSPIWTGMALVTAILCFCLLFNRHPDKGMRKRIVLSLSGALAAAYVVALAAMLLGGRSVASRGVNLIPFWSYRAYLAGGLDYLYVNILNVLLFVPFGFCGMLFISLSAGRERAFVKTVLAGLAVSLLMEVLQFVLSRGLAEFDDVFHNTLGAALGAAAAMLFC